MSTKPLIYFLVSGHMGVAVARASDRGAMLRAVRKRFGTVNEPFTVEMADLPQLQNHLGSGCMFFEADLSTVVPPEEAYRRADLPLPSKFARAEQKAART